MKKGVSKSIAFILMMSLLPCTNIMAENDLTVSINPGESLEYNADLFIKPGIENRVTQSYLLDPMFYNGEDYSGTVTLDSVEYTLYGDMSSRKDDVIKIDTSDVTIETEKSATKKLGLIVFSRESEEKETDITLNYENGKTEEYTININNMTNDNGSKGGSPVIVEQQGSSRYVGVIDETKTVYLQSVVIDLSDSVNKNLNLESVTFHPADFSYYLAAMTQIKFSADEIEEQTRETIRNYFDKYKDMNFYKVVNGENGASLKEVSDLYSSLVKQIGKMEEATEENIEKIDYLIKSSELYSEFDLYLKGINEAVLKYSDVSSDFSELSETELSKEDYEKLSQTVELYEKYDMADIDSMNEAIEKYNISESVDITIDDIEREKIYALFNAYKNAELKSELRTEIEVYYDEYVNKDISEITEADYEKLKKLIEAFKKAEDAGIEFEEYNDSYINHLYNDYDAFKASEEDICIDISSYYNIDMYADEGDSVNPESWYECHDNLMGYYFKTAQHRNMTSFNNGFISVKEFEYVKEETYDESTDVTTVKYPFTDTGRTITYYMPENCFDANVLDSVLFAANSKESYTFKIDAGYSDKLFVVFSNLTAKMQFEPVIKYTDSTVQNASVLVNYNGQIVHEVTNLKDKVYPNVVSYITSGNYKNQNLAATGIIYSEEKNTTNGVVIAAIELDNTKMVDTVTIEATGANFSIGALSLRPCSNDIIIDRVGELYNSIVSDGEIVSNDVDAISDLVMNYKDAKRRGLYVEGVDEDIINELSQFVLTGTLNMYRFDKNTVKAEAEFSVPVAEETVRDALIITSDEETVTDFTYLLNEEQTKLIIDIPVSKVGGNKLLVNIRDTLKIRENKEIAMVNSVSGEYSVPEFISAEYIDNYTLKITNNSKINQNYIAYAEITANGEKIYKSVTGSVEADNFATSVIDTNLYLNPEIKIAVLDADTLEPLCELYEIDKTVQPTAVNADYTAPTLDFNTDTVKINGFVPSENEGELVSCMIYSPVGELIYAGEITTNEDGYFCFEVSINQEDVPVSGNLKIKLGADDFNGVYENNDVYFPVMSDRINIVTKIKNASKTELAEILKEAQQELSLNFTPFIELINDEKTLAELSDRIYSVRDDIQAVSSSDSEQEKGEKISEAQNIIKQQSVLLAMQEKNTELFSDSPDLLYDDVMQYSSVDSDGVTIYEIYRSEVSDDGKKEIIKVLSGNNYKNVSDMLEDFKKAVILQGLKNPKNKGVGHVSKILTKENAKATDIDISEYLALNSKSEANSYIANMNITTLEDVIKYIDTLDDEKKGSSSSGGSSGGSYGGGVTIIPTEPVADQEEIKAENEKNNQNTLYVDMAESHWAYSKILELTEKGIVNGKGNGRFAPEESITRAEFVKILCVAMGISTDKITDKFTDVKSEDWYAPYVSSALEEGIIKGVSETEFGADANITRQDICTIIARLEDTLTEYELTFEDALTISEYAKTAVSYLYELGVINGFEDNTFRPQASATRAQAAVIICNYLNKVQ